MIRFALLSMVFFISANVALAGDSLVIQTMRGYDRICTYSNGVKLTMANGALCPRSSGIPSGQGSQLYNGLSTQTMQGYDRICTYGNGLKLTMSNGALCPR